MNVLAEDFQEVSDVRTANALFDLSARRADRRVIDGRRSAQRRDSVSRVPRSKVDRAERATEVVLVAFTKRRVVVSVFGERVVSPNAVWALEGVCCYSSPTVTPDLSVAFVVVTTAKAL